MKAMRRAFKVVILARASESGYSCLGFFPTVLAFATSTLESTQKLLTN